MSLTLAKAEEGETSLKTRVQNLNQTLSQSNYQAADLQQKMSTLQNALQSSEAERRVAQDKLEQARYKHMFFSLVSKHSGLFSFASDKVYRRARNSNDSSV